MGKGINKAVIVGTLGTDPEIKYAENGNAVVNVSVATNESWKDRTTGEAQERTEWHRIVMFGKLGEIAQQYLKRAHRRISKAASGPISGRTAMAMIVTARRLSPMRCRCWGAKPIVKVWDR